MKALNSYDKFSNSQKWGISMSTKRKGSGYNTGTKSIIFIVIIFLVVMSVQIFKLNEKNSLLKEREETLLQQQTAEEDRAKELEELDLYTKSTDYIKDMANKMGLVFENEIIFKESDE